MDDAGASKGASSEHVGLVLSTVEESIRTGEYRRFVETLRPVERESASSKTKARKSDLNNNADAVAAGLVLKMLKEAKALLRVREDKVRNVNEPLGASGSAAEIYGRMFAKAYETLDAAHTAAPIPGWDLGYRIDWLPERGQVVLTIEVFRLDPEGHVIGTPMTSVREVEATLPSVDLAVRREAEALRREVATYLQRFRALEARPRERYPRPFDELWQPRRLMYRTEVRDTTEAAADILSPQLAPDPHVQFLRERRSNRTKPEESRDRPWSQWREQLRRGVILSRAGIGKTWIVRHEAIARADEAELVMASGSESVSLPFVIPLDEFASAAAAQSPLDAILGILRKRFSLSEAFFNHIAERLLSEQAFVIFDGLDLVLPGQRSAAEGALATFGVNSRAGMLVTCRTEAYDRAPFAFDGIDEELTLLPFGAGDAEQFIGTWFGDDIAASAALQKRIAEDPSIRALAHHPLSLAFLCTVASSDAVTAPMRAGLYEGVLLTYLEGDRGRRRPVGNVARIEAKLRILQHVAFEWATGTTGWTYRFTAREVVAALAAHTDIVSKLYDDVDGTLAVQRILHEFLVEDGVFTRVGVSDGPESLERFEFFHNSIHEFLVAKHLSEMHEAEWLSVLDTHRWEGRAWEEVLVLLAQLVPRADPLIARLLAEPEDAFHAMLLLGARCAAEARPRVSPSLCEEVIRRLIELLDAPSVFDVDRAGRALAAMGAPAVPALRAAVQRKRDSGKYREAGEVERLLFQMADVCLLDFYRQQLGGERRKDAAIAIGQVGDPRATGALVDGLRDWDDYHARDGEYAIGGLAEIPDRRAVWELIGIACGNFKRLESQSWAPHAWWLLSSARPRRVVNEDAVLRRTMKTLTDTVARFGLDGLQFAVAQTARPLPDRIHTWSRYGPGPRIRRLAFGSESEISASLRAIDAAIEVLRNPVVDVLRTIYGDFEANPDDRRLAAKLLVAGVAPEQLETLLWGHYTHYETGKPHRYLHDFVLDALIEKGGAEHAAVLRGLLNASGDQLGPVDRLRVARKLFTFDPDGALPVLRELLTDSRASCHERVAAAEEVAAATDDRALLVTTLLKIVATEDERSAVRAAERLATLRAMEALPELRRLLRWGEGYEDPFYDEINFVELHAERRASAIALGLLQAAEATNDLMEALQDDAAIARNAAEALGRIGDAAATESLRKALQRRGLVEQAAVLALHHVGDHATVETWIRSSVEGLLHESRVPFWSEERLLTIAKLGTESALRGLIQIAERAENVAIRCNAVTALSAYPLREQLLRAAGRVLRQTAEMKVRSAAADVIRRWRGPFVVGLLLDALTDPDARDEAKSTAIHLLKDMDLTGHSEHLLRALDTCPRTSFFGLASLIAQTAHGSTAILLAERILSDFPTSSYRTTSLRYGAGSYELLMMVASEIRRSAPDEWPHWQHKLSEVTQSVAPSAFAHSTDAECDVS